MNNPGNPEASRSRRLFLAAVVLAAIATVAVTALLINIFERKQEAKNPFYRVVELNDTIEITKFDHKVVENACRRCHESITSAIDGNVIHGNAAGLECTRCHNSVGHSESAAARNHFPLWSRHE